MYAYFLGSLKTQIIIIYIIFIVRFPVSSHAYESYLTTKAWCCFCCYSLKDKLLRNLAIVN